MDKSSANIAGGVGAAAVLAFVLGPWSAPNNPVASNSESARSTSSASETTSQTAQAPTTMYSLSESEMGPWYALCNVFATIDPEDLETTSSHATHQEAGIVIHPPLSKDADQFPEEIKEETVTRNGKQWKYTPHYHYRADLSSCLPPKRSHTPPPELQYIIATVPDPLGSHLALQFDRDIVAIERAAASKGFGFERYWFPWSGLSQPQIGALDSNQANLKQKLREEPGILIFRKFTKPASTKDVSLYSPRLIVFLVGETPTSGINKIAFTKATRYIAQLDCTATGGQVCRAAPHPTNNKSSLPCAEPLPISVLGPHFSASFSPLYRALQDLRNLPHGALCISAKIYSPNTTVKGQRFVFTREMTEQHLGDFTPLAPLDCRAQITLLSYLRFLGYTDNEIAYLSEDETSYAPGLENTSSDTNDKSDCTDGLVNVFGQATESSQYLKSHIQTLTYPRDLSALRNKWQPTSIAITPADISGEGVKAQLVPFSLHEPPSNQLDSPLAFATEQAASDIDQALSTIITTIRHARYRAVVVTASNPLDEVYLLQYLRQHAPDVRLATYDQDSLMLGATTFDTMHGTISVTSFPIISTMWLGPTNTTTFPNSASEAIYVAAMLLIKGEVEDSTPHTTSSSPRVPNLSNPAFLSYLGHTPGVYLLGNDGFWPVQLSDVPPPLLAAPPIVPWIWYVFSVAILGFSLFHLWRARRLFAPHRRGHRTSWRRLGLGGSSRKEDLTQDYFLIAGTNQLFMLMLFILLPSLLLYREFIAMPPGIHITWSAILSLDTLGLVGPPLIRLTILSTACVLCISLCVGSILAFVRACNTRKHLSRAFAQNDKQCERMSNEPSLNIESANASHGETVKTESSLRAESPDAHAEAKTSLLQPELATASNGNTATTELSLRTQSASARRGYSLTKESSLQTELANANNGSTEANELSFQAGSTNASHGDTATTESSLQAEPNTSNDGKEASLHAAQARVVRQDETAITRSELAILAAYPIITIVVILYALTAKYGDVYHTAARFTYMADGISPILVISSVIAVWYLFSITGLRAIETVKAMKVDPLLLSIDQSSDCDPWLKTIGISQRLLLKSTDIDLLVKLDKLGGCVLLGTYVVLFALQGWTAFRGVDDSLFRGWLIFGGVGLLCASIMVQCCRVWCIWRRLRGLLALLYRSPFVEGFKRLPEELTGVKIWRAFEGRQSNALQDYTLALLRRIAAQSTTRMKATFEPYLDAAQCYVDRLLYKSITGGRASLKDQLLLNACFDASISPSIKDDARWLQERCAIGDTLVIDYAALRYVALIKYINAQMRWLLGYILYGFVFLIVGIKTYPFQGQHTIASLLTIIFSVMVVIFGIMFIQMDSDPLLSTLEHSTPGKANYFEAALRLLSVGGIPLIAVVASQFPSIERFLLSWIRPTLESLH